VVASYLHRDLVGWCQLLV
jgi:hypothetical protein